MIESPAAILASRLAKSLGRDLAHRSLDVALRQFTNVELAALAARWEFWARPKQLAPAGKWRSWGFLTGRGFGKTRACAEYINAEVEAGRTSSVVLIAQTEDKSVEVHVEGPTGLIATSPPWFRPTFEATPRQLVWPNGARAYVRTPETPGNIRSGEHDIAWCSEIQSWPAATRMEAWMNIQFATRRGYARTVWDATPKRRHPILKMLLKRAAERPENHCVVRGTSYENAANLGTGVLEDLEAEYGGTQQGREELGGEMLGEEEGALVKQEWIDRTRRQRPDRMTRKAIGLDPAVTSRRGSDTTGIALAGLGVDGQVLVLGDRSGKYKPDEWAGIVVAIYLEEQCDCIVVETNKGGDLVTQNLRAFAERRGLSVVVLGKDERPQHLPAVLYVREVHARGDKMDRAQPLATAYERGRVSHVIGVDLVSLEDTLTTWEPSPGADSPGDLDALVHVSKELLGLADHKTDHAQGFKGIDVIGQALASATPSRLITPQASSRIMSALLGGGGGRDGRI